jgi:hypothetical protein
MNILKEYMVTKLGEDLTPYKQTSWWDSNNPLSLIPVYQDHVFSPLRTLSVLNPDLKIIEELCYVGYAIVHTTDHGAVILKRNGFLVYLDGKEEV